MKHISSFRLDELRKYFTQEKSVALAFLFGSFVKGENLPDSDADIAVYFWPKGGSVEWEESGEWPEADEIWTATEKILNKNVDLLILNKAPALLAFDVFRTGKPVVIKDRSLYLRLFLLVSSAAMDFGDFIKDYWEIEQRSASLNEFDKIRLIEIIKFLSNELTDFDFYSGITLKDYKEDKIKKRSLEHWTENLINASIDVAKILLASEKKPLPGTYKEILSSLALLEKFDQETAENLSKFAKLRNILTHEYLEIRFEEIKKFLKDGRPSVEYLIDFVKTNYIS